MNTEHNTSVTLKISVYIGVAAVLIGLIAYLLDMGDTLLRTGLLIVIISPLAGVVVTTVSPQKRLRTRPSRTHSDT